MSIVKNISSLPNTARTFSDESDYCHVSGYFITEKQTLFADFDELNNVDNWHDHLDNLNLTPIHYVKEIEYQDEETIYNESLQDFTYKARDGKRRQRAKFVYTIDKYALLSQLSGSDYYIIYYDRNNNVRLVKEDDGSYRGIKTNRIQLEKIIEATESTPAFTPLNIEFSEDFNAIEKLDFRLTEVDRLFMTLTVQYVDSDNINFSATYKGSDIDSITASDITVVDNVNGELTFGLFSYLGGVYKLSDFNANVINGYLKVLANLYLGCSQYRYSIVVSITNSVLFEDGENFVFEDGENFIFEN